MAARSLVSLDKDSRRVEKSSVPSVGIVTQGVNGEDATE